MALTAKQETFLAAFRECGLVTVAARAAICSRKNHSRWLNASKEYAEAFADAKADARDKLLAEAIRRATEGTQEPVFYNGKICGHRVKYSDGLLMFVLKALDPSFRDTSAKTVVNGETRCHRDVSAEIAEAKQAEEYLNWRKANGLPTETESMRAELCEAGTQ